MDSKVTFLMFNIILLTNYITSLPDGDDDHDIEKSAIQQGTRALPKQFPYVVYMRSEPVFSNTTVRGNVCSGSILTQKWVITAAHCYRFYPRNHIGIQQVKTTVIAGSIDISTPTNNKQTRFALRYVLIDLDPSKTFQERFNNDIALVELSTALIFTEYVKPITVALRYPQGTKIICNMIGFGLSNRQAYESPMNNTILLYTEGRLDGRSESCRRRAENSGYGYLSDWNRGHLCLDPYNATSAPCDGDSGGPMVCEGLLTGVSSGRLNMGARSEPECGLRGNYHIYSFVGYFDTWVRQYISDLPRGQNLTGRGDIKGKARQKNKLEEYVDEGDGYADVPPVKSTPAPKEKPEPSDASNVQYSLVVVAMIECALIIVNLTF